MKLSPAEWAITGIAVVAIGFLFFRSSNSGGGVAPGQTVGPSASELAATNAAALASTTQQDQFLLAEQNLHASSVLTLAQLADSLKQTKLQNAATLAQLQASGATQLSIAQVQANAASQAAAAQASYQQAQLAVAKTLGLSAISEQGTVAQLASSTATSVASTQANAAVQAANAQANAYQSAASSQANASIFGSILGAVGGIFAGL